MLLARRPVASHRYVPIVRATALAAAGALLWSCSDGTGPEDSKPGVTSEGAILRAESRQANFSGADTGYVDIVLENPRDTAITLTFASDCEILGFIIKPDGESLIGGFYSCNMQLGHDLVLAPGAADTLTMRLWSPLRAGNESSVPLAAGTYTVFGRTGPLSPGNRLTESNRAKLRYTP